MFMLLANGKIKNKNQEKIFFLNNEVYGGFMSVSNYTSCTCDSVLCTCTYHLQ